MEGLSRIPRHEMEPERLVQPSERTPGYFQPEDRVVVFGLLGYGQRGLKRGSVDHCKDGDRCVIVDLDVKPPRRWGPSSTTGRDASKQGVFTVRYNEPTVMTEAEFEALNGDQARVREWVSGMTDRRAKEALCRALTHSGITEVAAKPDQGADGHASNILR
jgi:hypothetical protein